MRKFVLFIIAACFTTPAFADGLECTQALTPREPFIQAVIINHPDLDPAQRVTIAHMYELAYNQKSIVENEATTVADRELAERTQNIAMRLAAIQLKAFDSLPGMRDVVERMRAEEVAGLNKVSDELEPDVRHVAATLITIALTWSELSNDVVQLSTDRFAVIAGFGDISDGAEAAQRTMCTVEATMDVVHGVVDIFPGVAQLAYIKNLYY